MLEKQMPKFFMILFLLLSYENLWAENTTVYEYQICWIVRNNDVIFKFNDEEIGIGQAGFKKILEHLQNIPIGSDVYIFPVPFLLKLLSPVKPHSFSMIPKYELKIKSEIPFTQFIPEFEYFLKICREKNITVWCLPGEPGRYRYTEDETENNDVKYPWIIDW